MPGRNVKFTVQPVTKLSDQSADKWYHMVVWSSRDGNGKGGAAHQPDESGRRGWPASVAKRAVFFMHFDNSIALSYLYLGTFGRPAESNIFLLGERM